MKKIWMAVTMALLTLSTSPAFACSGLLVGKKASVDGSVIISYAADSHNLYGEMYRWPATQWPVDAMLDIKEWDTGKPLGQIKQVSETYSVLGNMNEYQVAITETTFGGREELVNPEGIMDYGSLIYVALQRSKSAREAIQVMTSLVKEYGYYSSGESFSIADKNEAWIMEMIGKGKGNKGAVWVAIRIPDDCISAHANQSRIQQIPFADKENCMYSPDVVSFAKEKGYYNGSDKDFSFQAAYCPYTSGGLRFCEARVWSFFKEYKDMNAYKALAMGDITQKPMPLYIHPDRKLSVRDIQHMMRDHFEGTEMDMAKEPGAGPFKVPYRWRPLTYKVDGKTYLNERAIATQQTGFVIVPQMRNWLPDEIGGILWFGVDDANTTVFNPIYSSSLQVPKCYEVGNGDLYNFSWSSAFWIHNWVANMAYNKYNYMIKDIRKVQNKLEDNYETAIPAIDKAAQTLYDKDPQEARKFLTWYSTSTAESATKRWKKLGEYLIVKYIDGNIKKEENGKFKRNPYGVPASPDQPGYDEDYYKKVVNQAGALLELK